MATNDGALPIAGLHELHIDDPLSEQVRLQRQIDAERDRKGLLSADRLTMRDFLACNALTALADLDDAPPAEIAALCYELADAMLTERAKSNG